MEPPAGALPRSPSHAPTASARPGNSRAGVDAKRLADNGARIDDDELIAARDHAYLRAGGRYPTIDETMQFQFNTDHSIHGSQAFAGEVEAQLRTALGHWIAHLTRVEVHLRDVNAGKGGDADKHCGLEARIAGRAPLLVSDSAATMAQAIRGATAKLQQALEHAIGKTESHRRADPPNAE